MGNVFTQYDSRGIPLSDVFGFVIGRGGMPCWVSFYKDARRCGWKDEKILTTVEQSLRDSGVKGDVDELIRRFRRYIQHQGQ